MLREVGGSSFGLVWLGGFYGVCHERKFLGFEILEADVMVEVGLGGGIYDEIMLKGFKIMMII